MIGALAFPKPTRWGYIRDTCNFLPLLPERNCYVASIQGIPNGKLHLFRFDSAQIGNRRASIVTSYVAKMRVRTRVVTENSRKSAANLIVNVHCGRFLHVSRNYPSYSSGAPVLSSRALILFVQCLWRLCAQCAASARNAPNCVLGSLGALWQHARPRNHTPVGLFGL